MEQNRNSNSNSNSNTSRNRNSNFSGGDGGNFVQELNREIMNTERKLDMLQQIKDTYDGSFGNRNFSSGGRSSGYGDSNSNRGNSTIRGNSRNGNMNSGGRDHGLRNEDGSVDQRQFNSGRQNFSGGSNDETDDRTIAGRSHDDEDFTQDQLYEALDNPDQNDLNEDGSFDRRTKIGRALYAAGMIDDNGFPIESTSGSERGNNRNRGNRSSSNRGD